MVNLERSDISFQGLEVFFSRADASDICLFSFGHHVVPNLNRGEEVGWAMDQRQLNVALMGA